MLTRTSVVSPPRRVSYLRFGLILLSLPLAACQMPGPSEPPQPRLAVDKPAVGAAPVKPPATGDVTFTVKRGTLRDSVSIPGRVEPAQSVQLSAPVAGTITGVSVRSGQEVHSGDALVEVSVDEAALETARTRARLADLEYAAQQARIDDLKRGSGPEQIGVARAMVNKAQAALQHAQLAQQAAQQEADAANTSRDTAAKSADREVSLAEVGVRRANEELSAAQAEVKRLQDLTQALATEAQDQVKTAARIDSDAADKAAIEAATATQHAAAATRAAQRRVDAATTKLDDARSNPKSTEVLQAISVQQNQVDLAETALKDAQAEAEGLDGTKDPTGVIKAGAVEKVRTGGRQFGEEQTRLEQQRVLLEPAKASDARAIHQAEVELDQAKDELTQAQAAEQLANQNQQRTRVNPPSATNLALQAQIDLPGAEARVRAAQTSIDAATLQLDQAHALHDAPPATTTTAGGVDPATKIKMADVDIKAAQADVDESQANLARLEQGPDAAQLEREQNRLGILQEESDSAHQAIRPTVAVAAPFDGTVSSVGVTLGQTVDARAYVARIAGQGAMSVVASAAEGDVNHLTPNQKVAVTFPGLSDTPKLDGTVVDISGAAATGTTADNKTAYPVTVQLSSIPSWLRLGMTAAVNVDVRAVNDVLFVPTNAIRNVDGKTLVTSIQPDGQLADSPVGVGETIGGNVEVVSGLHEGDVVTVFSSSLPTAKKP